MGKSLQDALGMNDWMPNRPVTGASALRRDLDQAVQDRRDAGESWDDWASWANSGGSEDVNFIGDDGGVYVSPVQEQPSMIPNIAPSSVQTQDSMTFALPAGLNGSPGLYPSMSVDTKPISVDEAANENAGSAYNKSNLESDWERKSAEKENRPVRVANLFGEEYENPESFFDNQLNLLGNTPTNDAYVRYLVANGLSEDDAYAITHKPQSLVEEKQLNETRNLSPGIYDGTGGLLDDGSMNYFDLTADKMTGAQYLKYADIGMGGRPTEEIVPDEIYSKRREFLEHGFIPFTPDTSTYLNMITNNVLDFPWRLGSAVGNLRETLTPDYTINYGDQSISGGEFDKLSPAYLGQFNYYNQFDPEKYLTKPESGNYTPLIFEHTIPDVSGNETYHYGSLKTVDPNPDGTYVMGFSDGSTVDVSKDYIDTIIDPTTNSVTLEAPSRIPVNEAKGKLPENIDSLNDINYIRQAASQNGISPLSYADVIYVPDMTLSDGTRISLNDVERIAQDETDKDDSDNQQDDDISYKFSGGFLPFATNKPKRLMDQEPFDFENGISINMDDMINNTWDWTLGSIPISVGKTIPWLYSLSGASSSVNGIDPNTYNPTTDSYSFISGAYDDKGNAKYGVFDENGKRDDNISESTRWWNAAGNALVPLTEMIVGPIGGQIIPLEKMFGSLPANPTAAQVLKNTLIGAAGEGIEEDLGNTFEDLTQYGWQGLFANQKKDEEGNPLYDDFRRHELRDYDTSIEDRIRNALDPSDLANAFAGGAAVDFAMDALLSPINKNTFTRQIGPALQRDMARRKTGVQQYVESEPERQAREAVENSEAPEPWETLDNASYLEGFRDDIEEEE